MDAQSAKTTGVGGEQRGYDGVKKVNGRKRQVLVDTEGLVVKAKVHSAKIADQDGLKLLLRSAEGQIERLSHLWLDSGYRGRGAEWARQELDLSVEVVHRSPKPDPEKMSKAWAKEWFAAGKNIDLKKLFPRLQGFEVLPRSWVVERSFAWIAHNRRMSKDYEKLCSTGEALIYASMIRLTVRRLASKHAINGSCHKEQSG